MRNGISVLVPLHITGFWISITDEDPIHTGSIGAGINLEPCLKISSIGKHGLGILHNDKLIVFNTLADAYKNLGFKPYISRLHGENLLGAGFGLSAGYSLASLIISAYENRVNISLYELGRAVHIAEVVNRTGYGDVSAMITGGLEFRRAPGAPGISVVDKIPVYKDIDFVVSISGGMTTPDMLKRYGAGIRRYGPEIYAFFDEDPSIERFFEASYKFSRYVGMLSDSIESTIYSRLGQYIRKGVIIGFFKKKNLVVLGVERGYGGEIKNLLDDVWDTYVYTINYTGIRIV